MPVGSNLGASPAGDRATRPADQAAARLGDTASVPSAVDWAIRPVRSVRREGSRIARAIAPFMVRGLEGCNAAYDYPLLPLKDQARIDGAATRALAAMRLVTEPMLAAGKRVAWETYGVIIDSDEAHAIYDAMLNASATEDESADREAGDAQ